MIRVFRPHKSDSAVALAEALDGLKSSNAERMHRIVRPNDKTIMWGAFVANLPGRSLNNVPLRNKYEDALVLKEAGVRTVEVSRTRPMIAGETPVDPLIAAWDRASDAAEAFSQLVPNRNPVTIQGIRDLETFLSVVRDAASRPAPVVTADRPDPNWLPRRYDHVGGNDLLSGITTGDYYSKREQFVAEYRVHSFLGRSIRAGKKIHRTPQSETPFHGTPHEWIRSFDSGWQISYADDSGIKQRHRDIAHAAVKALGLAFGAVDIGELADGTLVVLEVNRAAGVEGGTTEAYARAVRRWISNEWTADNAPAE
jgi:hypothetical protein